MLEEGDIVEEDLKSCSTLGFFVLSDCYRLLGCFFDSCLNLLDLFVSLGTLEKIDEDSVAEFVSEIFSSLHFRGWLLLQSELGLVL